MLSSKVGYIVYRAEIKSLKAKRPTNTKIHKENRFINRRTLPIREGFKKKK